MWYPGGIMIGVGIGMGEKLARRLVSDRLWELAMPLLPAFSARRQGGGSRPLDERSVFTAVVYVVTSGSAWRRMPEGFLVSPATAHRRFQAWTRAGFWRRLRAVAADEFEPGPEREWALTIASAADERAPRPSSGRAVERGPRETSGRRRP